MYVLECILDYGYDGKETIVLAVSKDIELLKHFALNHKLGNDVFDEQWRLDNDKVLLLSFQNEFKTFCIYEIEELIKE